MWSDMSQYLKENSSCIYLKFVPEGLNPNEGLLLSQSQIYRAQCGYCCALSEDMSCLSNTKQPKVLLSKAAVKGTGHGEAMVVIVNVRTHLLKLSEVFSVTWFICMVYVWWRLRSRVSLAGNSCWTSNMLRGGGKIDELIIHSIGPA